MTTTQFKFLNSNQGMCRTAQATDQGIWISRVGKFIEGVWVYLKPETLILKYPTCGDIGLGKFVSVQATTSPEDLHTAMATPGGPQATLGCC